MLFTYLERVVASLGLAFGILLIAGAMLSSMNDILAGLKIGGQCRLLFHRVNQTVAGQLR